MRERERERTREREREGERERERERARTRGREGGRARMRERVLYSKTVSITIADDVLEPRDPCCLALRDRANVLAIVELARPAMAAESMFAILLEANTFYSKRKHSVVCVLRCGITQMSLQSSNSRGPPWSQCLLAGRTGPASLAWTH